MRPSILKPIVAFAKADGMGISDFRHVFGMAAHCTTMATSTMSVSPIPVHSPEA
jgi:hypothetical protein